MIRKAIQADINAVSEIYEHIHGDEQTKAYTGWIPGVYPTKETAEKALERGDMFVYEEDKVIVASAIINQIQVDVYANCNWKYKALDSEVMVLHTLSVDPSMKGKGIGKAFVDFYEDFARENGCKVARMDTNSKNIAARNLYAKFGYMEADIVPCFFNEIPDVQLVLLEKSLV